MTMPTRTETPADVAAERDAGTPEWAGRTPIKAAFSPCIYDLRLAGAKGFYADAAEFTGRVMAEIEARAGDVLDAYDRFAKRIAGERQRSRAEHALELLTLGMAAELHGRRAAC